CDGTAVGQARCRHVLLAEGARRRSGAWHAGAVTSRYETAARAHAALADAENFPPDEERQTHRRRVCRRNTEHTLDAGGGRLPRHAGLGRIHRRLAGADRPLAGEFSDIVELGAGERLGRFPRARSTLTLQYLSLPPNHRSGFHAAR